MWGGTYAQRLVLVFFNYPGRVERPYCLWRTARFRAGSGIGPAPVWQDVCGTVVANWRDRCRALLDGP